MSEATFQIIAAKEIPPRFAGIYRTALEQLKQAGRGKALHFEERGERRAKDGLRYAARALGMQVRIHSRGKDVYCTIV